MITRRGIRGGETDAQMEAEDSNEDFPNAQCKRHPSSWLSVKVYFRTQYYWGGVNQVNAGVIECVGLLGVYLYR